MASVKFATDWKSAGGRHYKAGTVASIDGNDARALVTRGIVQVVTGPVPTDSQAAKKESN